MPDATQSHAADTCDSLDTAEAEIVRTHPASHDHELGPSTSTGSGTRAEADTSSGGADAHDGSSASVGAVAARSKSGPSTYAYVNAAVNNAERATAGAAEDPTAASTPVASAPEASMPAVPIIAASIPVAFELTDFGDDAYTRGRPHPMIDNTLRLRAMAEAVGDPEVGVLLLDVVLGRGAHADPAGEVAAAVAGVRGAQVGVAVVVSLCGTDLDPQGLGRQAEVLAGAGAWVFLSNAEAAGAALVLARGGVPGGLPSAPGGLGEPPGGLPSASGGPGEPPGAPRGLGEPPDAPRGLGGLDEPPDGLGEPPDAPPNDAPGGAIDHH